MYLKIADLDQDMEELVRTNDQWEYRFFFLLSMIKERLGKRHFYKYLWRYPRILEMYNRRTIYLYVETFEYLMKVGVYMDDMPKLPLWAWVKLRQMKLLKGDYLSYTISQLNSGMTYKEIIAPYMKGKKKNIRKKEG